MASIVAIRIGFSNAPFVSALDDVEGESGERGLLVAGLHIEAGEVHGANDLIERDLMFFRLLHGNAGGVDGLDGAHGVAFDAGDLNKAADGIAGHAEVVLHGDLGGMFDLSGSSAERGGETTCGHRAGDADFALAAYFRAADGSVLLI